MRKRIVVIEDDDDTRAVIRIALEGDGYDVQASADAFGDIKHANADLVILDLYLHGDTAGWEQLDVLTLDPATRGIPVIIASAATASLASARERLAQLDVTVLEKPFDLERLSAAVESALASAPRRPDTSPAD